MTILMGRFPCLRLALLTFISFFFFNANGNAQNVTISGYVTSSLDNSPIAGVRVQLYRFQNLIDSARPTKEDGRFTFSVNPGIYTILVQAPNFDPLEFEVVSIIDTSIDLILKASGALGNTQPPGLDNDGTGGMVPPIQNTPTEDTILPKVYYNLSGYVKDGDNGESLIGATVSVPELGVSSRTNSYGYYSLTLPAGKHTLKIVYFGFEQKTQEVEMTKSNVLNLDLLTQSKTLEEAEIISNAPTQDLKGTQMSKVELPISQVKKLPALFGEVDILKTIQLLPGIQTGSEGSTGFYVRGGGSDQNLIVLDEATVYNASHLFGFFSVFNSDAIRNVDLYKGGFPAKYGGRLSSVIDVSLKDGNSKKFSGSGGIGLIATRLTLEGPIVKDKASFIISGRRTYVDVFTKAINKSNADKAKDPNYQPIPDYFFYDLNAKVNYTINDRNRIYLSSYFGRDVFKFNSPEFDFRFFWGNATVSSRWNHLFGNNLFMNVTGTFTDYKYIIENTFDIFKAEIGSDIRDYTGKVDFNWQANSLHTVTFGASAIAHRFGVGRFQFKATDNSVNIGGNTDLYGGEYGVYANDEWDISARLRLAYGLRVSGFSTKDKLYIGPEPRTSVRYSLTDKLSLKASYMLVNQYVHLVSNSGTTLPTDIWYPTTKLVKPQRGQQGAAGLTYFAEKLGLTITDEVFYKDLRNQIDYKNNAQTFLNPDLEQEYVFGKGWSYGNELFVEKRQGRTTGWISYTLSWAQRQIAELNGGRPYYPRYDSRHNMNIVTSYDVSKRVTISGAFVYKTGFPYTIQRSWFPRIGLPGDQSSIGTVFSPLNSYRLAPYHRLDLSLVWKFNPKWGESDLTFSVYNVYSRKNPYFLYVETTGDDNTAGMLNLVNSAQAKQVSLFPIIPAVTYNFKF